VAHPQRGAGPDYYKLPGATIRYSEADLDSCLKQRKVSS
jgi:hypothetical protein